MTQSTAPPANDKQLSIMRGDLDEHSTRIMASARHTLGAMEKLVASENPIAFLEKLKFYPIGCDPLDATRSLNLIEQLNQTFTYIASFKGAELLFSRHPEIRSLRLNLGTSPGFDIESDECGGVAAEVFAAVDPKNNQKLANDYKKVLGSHAKHRYVLYMSPKGKEGPVSYGSEADAVCVWSLGHEPESQFMRSPC